MISSFSFVFDSVSGWLVIPCLLAGGAYAYFLYYPAPAFSKRTKNILAVCRFLAISILCFLLLSPLIRMISKTVEKPIIIVAHDNSSSLLLAKNAAYYKKTFPEQLDKLLEKLEDEYVIKRYSFGSDVKERSNFLLNEKKTDFSKLFNELNNRYSNQNVGAMIIASDGIYNQGSNPLYTTAGTNAPIYTLALGDTTPKKDLLIEKTDYNHIVYLGNNFRINISLAAFGCNGERTKLTVRDASQVLFTKDVSISQKDFRLDIPVDLEAKQLGFRRYTISASPVTDEVTVKNNSLTIFIEVLDGKQKILILANAPHPDLSALKQSIENNRNYEADIAFANDFNTSSLEKYGLVILHNLPTSQNNPSAVISKIQKSGTPAWFIIGSQVYLDLFNRLQTGLKILASRTNTNELQAKVQDDFYLFTLSDETKTTLAEFPPLVSPFGNYSIIGSFTNLFTQKIGSVETNQPLLTFIENGENKTVFLCGEGLWKWRLYNFQLKNNHDAVNELTSKIVQYLSAKGDKRKFRISLSKNTFDETETITFDAELYNDSYELVNTPEVTMQVKNGEGKSFPYTFSKAEQRYMLNAGALPVGNYKYTAQAKLGDKSYTASGEFIVSQLNLEELQSTANHQLLYALSEKSGGKMLTPENMEQLPLLIASREEIKSVSYEQKSMEELINIKWVFLLLLVLLGTEWLIRKRSGAY